MPPLTYPMPKGIRVLHLYRLQMTQLSQVSDEIYRLVLPTQIARNWREVSC